VGSTVAEDNGWVLTNDLKAVIAELIGTFTFVFLGAGSAITATKLAGASGGVSLLLIAFGNGLGLALAITAIGHISGGHLNPAVTVALWVTQRIATSLAIVYIIAQLLGATLAALLLRGIFSPSLWNPVHLGAPALSATYHVQFGTGVIVEAVMTFFLVIAVFGTAVDPRHPQIGGFGIGLVVMLDVIVGGPITGAAMNPARAFGPFIAANYWNRNDIVFWIGPLLGAVIAGLIYGYVLLPHEDIDIASAPAVPGSDIEPVPTPETNPALEAQIDSGDLTS
jgi:MIP family channel proteins